MISLMREYQEHEDVPICIHCRYQIYLFLKLVYTFSFFLKSRLSGMRCIDLILNHNFCIYFHFVKSNVSSCQNLAQNHSLYCLKTHATVKFCFYFSLRQTINQKRISLGKGNHFVVFKTLKSSLGQNKL